MEIRPEGDASTDNWCFCDLHIKVSKETKSKKEGK